MTIQVERSKGELELQAGAATAAFSGEVAGAVAGPTAAFAAARRARGGSIVRECTRKLRNLEAMTIGGFVQKALSRVKSAEAKVEQGPGDVFSTIEREIGTVGKVQADILKRLASLRREVGELK